FGSRAGERRRATARLRPARRRAPGPCCLPARAWSAGWETRRGGRRPLARSLHQPQALPPGAALAGNLHGGAEAAGLLLHLTQHAAQVLGVTQAAPGFFEFGPRGFGGA